MGSFWRGLPRSWASTERRRSSKQPLSGRALGIPGARLCAMRWAILVSSTLVQSQTKGHHVRFLLLASALLLPATAFAQQGLPVTLTPQEYQMVVTELMGRDPVIRMLVQKQDLAH